MAIYLKLRLFGRYAGGNREFNRAKIGIESKIREFALPEVDYFMRHFAHGFSLTLDELGV